MAQPPNQPPNQPPHLVDGPSTLYRKIPCRAPGCNRWFCNNAGLTKHMRAKHSFSQPREHREPPDWQVDEVPDPPPEDLNAPADGAAPVPEERARGSEWEYHTHLCGEFSLPSPFA
jgi:hypothetical protein